MFSIAQLSGLIYDFFHQAMLHSQFLDKLMVFVNQLVSNLIPKQLLDLRDVYFLKLFLLVSGWNKIDLDIVGTLVKARRMSPYVVKYDFFESDVFETDL